ncbi:GDP-mannose 4,6-dehydratase [Roseomonas sp. OT10]|uniref:GDP-mannose 4,6-dehydratase n=1 Tax=Roseomonas cutis TaxID=2897332 RepID=UPI001E46BD0A|nr:GDP-mannose 4,6-dehydratase [Roseomonas sp. OT10]UFN48341.1 GDP-mannose 4,6-dehydratase [Roseomonas sp. OT10]
MAGVPGRPLPQRILVTGAGGFVGRHLMPVLRAAFPAARLLAASRQGTVAGAEETVPLDLLDPGLEAVLRRLAPDAVLHLAAQSSVPESFADPAGTWRVNLGGTMALGEAIRRALPETRLVHVSSAEVYGLAFQSGVPLTEDAPFRPANPYAASKAAADLAIGEMSLRGLNAVRLRPFNQAGGGQTDRFALAAFAKQVALIEAGKQEPVLRTGALDRWRDFLDVRDVCAAYAAALARPDLPAGCVFNIASGTPRRIGDILDTLIALAGIEVRIEEEASRLRPTDVERTAGDATAAHAALGWAPHIPWETTLGDLLQDWRDRVARG